MRKQTPTRVPPPVGYRYHSPDIPMAAIRRFARRLGERFQPDKIILFGSYAYGTPHAESDVDLLVVMRTSNMTNRAIEISLAYNPPFCIDLIVRTPEHIKLRLQDGKLFLREI